MSIPEESRIIESALNYSRTVWESLKSGPQSDGISRPAAPSSMAGRIEHTLLGAAASDKDVDLLCAQAREHSFKGVCCLPRDVAACAEALRDASCLVVSVIDFPLSGGGGIDAAEQCRGVVDRGADEVDMVVDIRALRRGDVVAARDKIRGVVDAAAGRAVKVILETGHLDEQQIVAGCVAAQAGGASFVKTSTGFGPRGASEQDIVIMRAVVGESMGVKASGGISERDWALRLVELGADVIGTSKGPICI